MPEPLPSPAEELAAEEAQEGLPVDAGTQEIAAVVAVPGATAARRRKKPFGVGAPSTSRIRR